MKSICIITPSHIGDIQQFSLLRRSIQMFAPHLQHVAIVNSEDCKEFRARFGAESQLEIVRTADVLPSSIERRRRKSGPRWRTGKWLYGPRIKGWKAQQLMKLYALADCSYDAAAFIDSDVFFCRPSGPDCFFRGDNLKLFRRRAGDAESLDFDISTHDILGNPLHQITELYDYIFSPACFRKSTAIRLFDEFKRRGRKKWVRRFLSEARPSEYNLLGYAATVLEGGAGYALLECNPDDLHHSIRFPEDCARLSDEIEEMQRRPKDFVLIQSSLGLEFSHIADAFDRVAQAHASRTAHTTLQGYAD
jgi:hypothetical protein